MTPESVRDLLKELTGCRNYWKRQDWSNVFVGFDLSPDNSAFLCLFTELEKICESWLAMHEELERVKNGKE